MNIRDFIRNIKEQEEWKNIYLWGAGKYGLLFGELLNEEAVKWNGYIDVNREKRGKILCAHNIFYNDELDYKKAFILITVSNVCFAEEIKKILDYLKEKKVKDEDILLVTEDLCLISEILRKNRFDKSSVDKIAQLKDIYIGKRAFLLGNGPSLNVNDIEKLKGELIFGCNRIDELMKKTNSQLCGFWCNDPIFQRTSLDTYEKVDEIAKKTKHIFTDKMSIIWEKWKDDFDNVYYFDIINNDSELYAKDITAGVSIGRKSSLYALAQVMTYMGIKEIILLGVDYSFHKEKQENGEVKVNTNINNHPEGMGQDEEGIYFVDEILHGWINIKKYAELNNIVIKNATRGGKLELFERVNLESLF